MTGTSFVANEPAALNGSAFLRGSWRVELQIQVHVLYRITALHSHPQQHTQGIPASNILIATPETLREILAPIR